MLVKLTPIDLSNYCRIGASIGFETILGGNAPSRVREITRSSRQILKCPLLNCLIEILSWRRGRGLPRGKVKGLSDKNEFHSWESEIFVSTEATSLSPVSHDGMSIATCEAIFESSSHVRRSSESRYCVLPSYKTKYLLFLGCLRWFISSTPVEYEIIARFSKWCSLIPSSVLKRKHNGLNLQF